MNWTELARDAVATAIAQAKRSDMTPDEILQWVDKAYPFVERSGTPYKTWLRIRKEKLIAAGVLAAPKTPDHVKRFWS